MLEKKLELKEALEKKLELTQRVNLKPVITVTVSEGYVDKGKQEEGKENIKDDSGNKLEPVKKKEPVYAQPNRRAAATAKSNAHAKSAEDQPPAAASPTPGE